MRNPFRRRSTDRVMTAAVRYLQASGRARAASPPDDLLQVLEDCRRHLLDGPARGRPSDEVREIVLLAWADLMRSDVRCYVDLEASSPNLIFLVDPVAGTRHAIPVLDLVKLLGPRVVSAA